MNSASLYIRKISSKLPSDRLSNREFSFLIPENHRPEDFNPDTADTWIEERTGISERAVAARDLVGTRTAPIETEMNLTLGALENFDITAKDWSELDAMVIVKSTPIQYSPSLSQKLIQHFSEKFPSESGNKGVFTLDLFQPSTGLLSALKVMMNLPFQNAWLIIPEVLTPFVNLKDPASAILFGDGVAALWLTKGPHAHAASLLKIQDVDFESIPDTGKVLGFLDTNESSYMKGPELFRKIIPEFKKSSQKMMERHQLTPTDIGYYLPHQANTRIVERAASSIGFSKEQLISNIKHVGNTGSASMLIALDHFLKSKSLKKGTRILMNACGAGLSKGTALLEAVHD